MFNTEHLYNLLKPKSNLNLITDYDVIIGGTTLPADLDKGCIIINVVSSIPVTSQNKDLKNIEIETVETVEMGVITESSTTEVTYQLDFYKVNGANLQYIEVEREALKVREYLKGYETLEYLEALQSSILPCYSQIVFSSELYNKKLTNRATFDFKILTLCEIKEYSKIAKSAVIENIKIMKGN